MVFENILEYTNQIYTNKGKALINKRATPMKIIGKSKGNKHICVFDRKSTVDYDGVYNGRAIVFEAKSTAKKSFPLDMITDEQIKYLDSAEKQGAISFLIVEMKDIQRIFIVHNGILQKYIEDAQKGGRKSIPIDDMEEYAFEVVSKNGVPLDYLSAVDRLIELKTA